jgi:hypothetical protein
MTSRIRQIACDVFMVNWEQLNAVGGTKPSKAPVKIMNFVVAIRTSGPIIGHASLIMSNLRTKRRENVGCGYTNQTAKGQSE